MPAPQVQVQGLRDFQKDLKWGEKVHREEFKKVHRNVSDLVGDRARAAMGSGGPQASRAAAGVKSRATQTAAIISTGGRPPYTLGVIWGMRRRSGWYAAKRYDQSAKRQFKPWVGSQWDPGEHGGKPYYIGSAINASEPEVERLYLEGIDAVSGRAFPT